MNKLDEFRKILTNNFDLDDINLLLEHNYIVHSYADDDWYIVKKAFDLTHRHYEPGMFVYDWSPVDS